MGECPFHAAKAAKSGHTPRLKQIGFRLFPEYRFILRGEPRADRHESKRDKIGIMRNFAEDGKR